MPQDNTPKKVKEWADSFVYVSLALGAILGINFKPYFEAKRDIAIEQARAESEVKIIKMQMELEKIKRLPKNNSPEIYGRIESLESNMVKVLELAHPEGGNNAQDARTRTTQKDQ